MMIFIYGTGCCAIPLFHWVRVGRDLELDGNGLSGSIPTEIGKLTNLKDYLFLDNNKLSGRLPKEI